MATKKQKRERGYQNFLQEQEDIRKSGLEALKKDQEHRKSKARQGWQDKHDKSHGPKRVDEECVICQEYRARQKHAEAKAAKAATV